VSAEGSGTAAAGHRPELEQGPGPTDGGGPGLLHNPFAGPDSGDRSRDRGAGVRRESRARALGLAGSRLGGARGAKVIQSMIDGTRAPSSGIVATVLGLATLFFGGSAAVSELRDALNTIWQVPDDAECSHARNLFNVI